MAPLLADSNIVDEDGVLFGDGGGRWDLRRFLFSIILMAWTVRSEKKTDYRCQSFSRTTRKPLVIAAISDFQYLGIY
ncbi:hypothetical protein L1987_64288 [Smallanthus sonchifolius]|uniref:Uncharacterized protein n=1 Tax=Smallanthus sonchifolius TaxID=185202 RepID=A0ACB9CFM8_9ASTR|nr:hypothetical protein L1987_64288 [Smallanthus sonchifolius]